jgi:hypothetical protein
VADVVMRLFEEYAERFERGERPDLRAYLERAGEGRDELASLVDVWLQVAPAPEPDEETVALTAAWIAGEPPLVTLRARRGLRRAEIVDRIIERFSLDRAKRSKVERYYHEVETGQLAPSPRIRDALVTIFGRALPDWRVRPLDAAPAYHRAPVPARPSRPTHTRCRPPSPGTRSTNSLRRRLLDSLQPPQDADEEPRLEGLRERSLDEAVPAHEQREEAPDRLDVRALELAAVDESHGVLLPRHPIEDDDPPLLAKRAHELERLRAELEPRHVDDAVGVLLATAPLAGDEVRRLEHRQVLDERADRGVVIDHRD